MTPEEIEFDIWFLNQYRRRFDEANEIDQKLKTAFLSGYLKGVTETRVSLQESLSRW
jgi:hypothetical protein